ncbi:MAG: AMP-binding protein [Candidatus Eisenbacteria sp.]|nr:AMP-binding protein [Candidatus Eisenbacteria bacterium]
MGLLEPMLRNLLRAPLRTVIVDDWRSWRGIHLLVAALHLARRIEQSTSRPHIGIMLPTSGLTPLAILATWMLGRTIVPINYLLRSEDRDFVIANAEVDTIITVSAMIDALGELPAGINEIRLDRIAFKGLPPLRRARCPATGDLAALLYTSGTSGRPKGVMLTAGNLESNIRQCIEWAGIPRKSVLLGVLPQFHCFGLTVLTLLPLWLGAKVIYTARFQPKKILDLLQAHRPTIMLAIPSMLNSLLNAKGAAADHFASVRYLVSGGEPLPQAIFDGFRDRFGVVLNEGYGLTETSPVANWCRPQEHKRLSVGPPLPGIEERIAAPDGSPLGVDQEGEVRIKGPNVMKGYYKLEGETSGAFDSEGFFMTGDMGRIDADRHLFITGRIKEMLVVAGENVFPRSIEEVLDAHPSVLSSSVIGMPDPGRGEVPIAFVELVPGGTFDEVTLRAHCRERLAPYQVPRRVRHLEQLPRSPTGKILRRELRNYL